MPIRRAILIPLCVFAAGCATSKITAFRDPAYPNARFSRIAVFALNMDLESAVEVERQTCSRLAPGGCVPGKTILPPIREYTADEVRERLTASGAEAVLVIGLASDDSNTQYLGTWSQSSATASGTSSGMLNLFGNSAYWSGSSTASATGNSVSAPIYGYSRHSRALLRLFEIESGNVVWAGQVTTSGKGALAVGNNEFIRSATGSVASQLRDSRLVGVAANTYAANKDGTKEAATQRLNERTPSGAQVIAAKSLTSTYEAPSSTSKIVYRVRKGAALPVIAELDGWFQVQIGDSLVYVSATDVQRR